MKTTRLLTSVSLTSEMRLTEIVRDKSAANVNGRVAKL